ncbi:MAG: histidine phosphatase family protein, partial [Tannerella sp.]|nr:histidine phosphatase family protein [Tannerella sp.]
MIELYFLRHAETEYNAHNQFVGGRSNRLPLSENGRRQALSAGMFFKDNHVAFDRVFCSTAVRAQSTLELITDRAHITDNVVAYSDELQELSQGEWEGRPRNEIYTPKRLAEIKANPWHFKAPGGESQKETEERMLIFIERNIIRPYVDGCFLLIGHGVAFRCLLRGILGIKPEMVYRILIDNVSLSKLRYDRSDGW